MTLPYPYRCRLEAHGTPSCVPEILSGCFWTSLYKVNVRPARGPRATFDSVQDNRRPMPLPFQQGHRLEATHRHFCGRLRYQLGDIRRTPRKIPQSDRSVPCAKKRSTRTQGLHAHRQSLDERSCLKMIQTETSERNPRHQRRRRPLGPGLEPTLSRIWQRHRSRVSLNGIRRGTRNLQRDGRSFLANDVQHLSTPPARI
jgi:hypothetical protein